MSIDYLVYGKLIVDHLAGGVELLGGGGPQGAFGARLWADSVGLLSRSGEDLGPHVAVLAALRVDLAGWQRYPDLPTPRARVIYDEQEQMVDSGLLTTQDEWEALLARPIPLPPTYRRPRAIHLISEFPDEPMVHSALALREQGALFSLEPLIVNAWWDNLEPMRALFPRVDILSPDWPSACLVAGDDEPATILAHWASYGAELVAIRRGAHGSYLRARDEPHGWHAAALPVDVVDPTGGGNAYSAALAVSWSQTHDTRIAAACATAAAAIMIGRRGVPGLEEGMRAVAEGLAGQVPISRLPTG